MKAIEERIAEAVVDRNAMYDYMPHGTLVRERLLARAEKRLADLEAVRDGKAVDVWATASVAPHRGWAAFGAIYEAPRGGRTLEKAEHEDGRDRLTILRGIAYLPVATTDEAEAESEGA